MDETGRTNPEGWPYADLHLSSPHCPVCGWSAIVLIAPLLYPSAMCANNECEVFTFDPTKPALEILLGAGYLTENRHEDGSVTWSRAEPPAAGT